MDICQIPTKGHVSCQSLAGQDWLPELLRHKIERDLPPVIQPMIIIITTVFMVWWNKGRYSSLATAGSALGSAGHPPDGDGRRPLPQLFPVISQTHPYLISHRSDCRRFSLSSFFDIHIFSPLPCHQLKPSIACIRTLIIHHW